MHLQIFPLVTNRTEKHKIIKDVEILSKIQPTMYIYVHNIYVLTYIYIYDIKTTAKCPLFFGAHGISRLVIYSVKSS